MFGTLRVIIAILITVKMTWVANLAIFFSCVGGWPIRHASSVNSDFFLEEDPVTHFVVFSELPGGRVFVRSPWNLGRSPKAEKHVHIGVGRRGP